MRDGVSSSGADASRIELFVVLLICLAITGYSFSIAHHAELYTPAVANFAQFAQPQSSIFQSKGLYLYGYMVFEAVALLALTTSLLPRRIFDRLTFGPVIKRRHVYFFIPFFVMALWGTYEHAKLALDAAAVHSAANPVQSH